MKNPGTCLWSRILLLIINKKTRKHFDMQCLRVLTVRKIGAVNSVVKYWKYQLRFCRKVFVLQQLRKSNPPEENRRLLFYHTHFLLIAATATLYVKLKCSKLAFSQFFLGKISLV